MNDPFSLGKFANPLNQGQISPKVVTIPSEISAVRMVQQIPTAVVVYQQLDTDEACS